MVAAIDTQLISWLEQRLDTQLPGEEAQFLMAPESRRQLRDYTVIPDNHRTGAVLMMLYKIGDEWNTLLTLRNKYPGVHSGQVSFPGGKVEVNDHSLEHTALRETEEEVGLSSGNIRLLGRLSDLYIPPSNFMVHPFVGYVEVQPTFHPDPTEVVELIETPLDHFLNEDIVKTTEIPIINDFTIEAPYFDVQGHVVWGATAMILSEFKTLLQEFKVIGDQ